MKIESRVGIRRAAKLGGVAAVLILAASACASGSHSGGKSSTGAAGASASGNAAAGAATTVAEHSGPMGTFLTDSSGKTLYMFTSDTASKSTCSGACTNLWPPLTTAGTAMASGGADTAKLGTIARSDGTTQVTYAGHPLYYYKGDSAAGATSGQGRSDFGAKWWLLAPSGSPITGSGSASPSGGSSSSSGGGGGGWA